MSAHLHVLSVEDVECNQQLVSLFLEPELCTVDQVQSGLDALAAVRLRQYDVILMDLRLPDMDGLEVVRRIRELEAGSRRQVIVALTADVLPARIAAARAAGVDAHLAKPFTRSALRETVAQAAGLHDGRYGGMSAVVAELAQNYGSAVVERLLRSLLGQLAWLDGAAGDAVELERCAHSIRGAAANLGFADLSHACEELEAACRDGRSRDGALECARGACAEARQSIARGLALAA